MKIAKEHGCYRVIHWPSNAYEDQLLERTNNACPEGIDVVIDFVSSPRTISRAFKFLNKVSHYLVLVVWSQLIAIGFLCQGLVETD